jgi:hypothetical protein
MDGLKRFSGPCMCPKCATPAVAAKYCEQDCVRGISDHGEGQYVGGTTMGADPNPHIHRKCKSCGFEWLETTADAAPGEGESKRCAFCLTPAEKVAELHSGLVLIEGATACICPGCVTQVNAAIVNAKQQLGLDKTSAGATVQ